MSNRSKFTLLGFLLFVLGFVALVMSMVGSSYVFLAWMEAFGRLGSLLIKLFMIFGGVVIVVLANADEDAYDEYFDGKKQKNSSN